MINPGNFLARMTRLLESAAESLAEFDESRGDDTGDEGGNQFAYGVAAGIYASVASMMADDPDDVVDFADWAASGASTEPGSVLLSRRN